MDTWEKPYIKKKTTKGQYKGKAGLYIIRDRKTKKILYIGMSKYCLYKALYTHFYNRKDFSCRVNFSKYSSIEVKCIITEIQNAHYYEIRLIRYFKPEKNHIYYKTSKEKLLNVYLNK